MKQIQKRKAYCIESATPKIKSILEEIIIIGETEIFAYLGMVTLCVSVASSRNG